MIKAGDDICEGRFRIIQKVGNGSFGDIYKGKPIPCQTFFSAKVKDRRTPGRKNSKCQVLSNFLFRKKQEDCMVLRCFTGNQKCFISCGARQLYLIFTSQVITRILKAGGTTLWSWIYLASLLKSSFLNTKNSTSAQHCMQESKW